MENILLIVITSLFLISYFFDLTFKKTKIPSVLLLLGLGMIIRWITQNFFDISVNFDYALPILGTIGLILIVLDGALEIELSFSKRKMMLKAILLSFLMLLASSFSIAFAVQFFSGAPFLNSLLNSIPLCVISSAMAIPSAIHLSRNDRHFITYESSFSDIFGVLFFNFIVINEIITFSSFMIFFVDVLLMLIISIVATFALSYMMSKSTHPVRFIPIIIIVLFIYAISKQFHFPALIFILIFGLLINNLSKIPLLHKYTFFDLKKMNSDVAKFKEFVLELTFVFKSMFFLLFGYIIEVSELMDSSTFIWAISISAIIFLIRYVLLRVLKIRVKPILFFAPRGLITILLFLSIPELKGNSLIHKPLIIQIIIITSLVMVAGLFANKENDQRKIPLESELQAENEPKE